MSKALQKKLLNLAQKDQEMRQSGKWNKNIDKHNTAELKKIIKKYHWPNKKLVGKKGFVAAWLIAQHADHDVKFQEQCLKLMTEVYAPNWQIAYLIDRILVNKNKKQIYGTQFYLTKNNRFIARPIKNKVGLNKRRKQVGLEPFEQYRKKMITKKK